MKPNHLSAVALLAFLAGGCANMPSVGPDYHAPETKAPAHWSEPLAGGETNSAAATAAWWKNFHDAELDSLIDTRGSTRISTCASPRRACAKRARNTASTFADFWPTVDGVRLLRAPAAKPEPTAGWSRRPSAVGHTV